MVEIERNHLLENEVFHNIMKLKAGKADSVSLTVLRCCAIEPSKIFCESFHAQLQEGVVPAVWKVSIISVRKKHSITKHEGAGHQCSESILKMCAHSS